MAIQSADGANTMVSTAENQKLSEKANASAPTAPQPIINTVFALATFSSLFTVSFFARAVMVQNKNITVALLARAQLRLVNQATLSRAPKDNNENTFPIIANSG